MKARTKTKFMNLFIFIGLIIFSTNPIAAGETCANSLDVNIDTEILSIDNVNRLEKIVESEQGEYQRLMVSPNDQMFVATTDTNAQVFALTETSDNPAFWNVCRGLKLLAFTSDASQVAMVEQDSSQIQLWDVDSNELITLIEGQRDEITSIALSPSSNLLAWAGSNTDNLGGDPWIGEASVFIYNLQSNEVVVSFEEIGDIVTQIQFTANNEQVMFLSNLAGYNNFNMQLWDLETNSLISNREAWSITSAFSNDTIALALAISLGITNEFNYQIEIWDNEMDSSIQTILVPRNSEMEPSVIPNYITALALNSDASLVAMGDTNGKVTIWDIDSGNQLSSFQAYSDTVYDLVFTHNDHLLISLGSENDTRSIRIWGITN